MSFRQYFELFTGWDDVDLRANPIIAALISMVLLVGAIIEPAMWYGIGGLTFWIMVQLLMFWILIRVEVRYLSRIDALVSTREAAARVRKQGRIGILLTMGFTYAYVAFLLMAALTFIVNAAFGT